MGCGPRGACKLMYRKPGKDTAHCKVQAEKGGQWDFCAHQYFCHRTNKWELTDKANACPLAAETPVKQAEPKKKTAKKKKLEPEPVKEAAPVEAETEAEQPADEE